MAARFAYANLLATVGAVLVPSSEETSMPRAALLRAKTSDRLRFKSGWTVTVNENDRIDFNRGGVKSAQITAGTYATGTLLAAAIVTALEAADSLPVWACTYNTGTKKFTISSDLDLVLLFSTGPNVSVNLNLDIGFAATDTGSGPTHTAGSVAYQSRHSVNLDLGASTAATVAIVRGHNVSTAGTIRMDGQASVNLVGQGLKAGGTEYMQTLLGTDPRIVYFASSSKRYLRLVIEDVQNPVGYNEIGIWFAGTYGQPTVLPSVQFSKDNEHLSDVLFADGGAHDKVSRTRRRVYKLIFQLEERAGLAVDDRALFDAIDALGIGTSFFMTLDVASDPTITVYGFLRAGLNEVYDRGTLWAIVMEFVEALP